MWFVKYLFANYFNFSGRTTRKTFWRYTLTSWLVFFVVFLPECFQMFNADGPESFPLLSCIIAVVFIIPDLSVIVRRLHDANRSGWWSLLTFIPTFRYLIIVIISLLKSSEGVNDYGYPEDLDQASR
nr:DUF805 domain-containing protein [uncultured Enterobacter sp.]